MLDNKKNKIIYISAAAVLVIIVVIATVFALSSAKTANNEKKTTTAGSAKQLEDQALKAYEGNDKAKAKQLYLEANKQYVQLNDSNKVVNTRSMLCQLGEKNYCGPAS